MTDNSCMTDVEHSVPLEPVENSEPINPYPLAEPVRLQPLSPYVATHAEYKDMLGAAGFALVVGSATLFGVLVGVFSVVFIFLLVSAFAGRGALSESEQNALLWVFGVFAGLAVSTFITGVVLGIIGLCKRVDKSGAKVSRVMSKITVIIAGFILVVAAVLALDFFAV